MIIVYGIGLWSAIGLAILGLAGLALVFGK